MEDSRKRLKNTQVIWFKKIYQDYLTNNEGYAGILEYIAVKYDGDKNHWAKVARWAGFKCMKRNGIYYFEA